tara:strand:- start:2853 stop:3839 length:987 start_codon:yes stop_codon:yes gene_type:complete
MTEIAISNKSQYSNNSFSTIIILTISILFALMVGSGLYGYGNDFYSSYYKANLDWGGLFDRLGFILATASINGIHLGVHIVTFILTVSAGFLIREHIKFKQSYSLVFFILLYITAIHTWPIIMSTSNAMRQGLSMSFIFLAFVAGSRRKIYWMTIFSILATLTHNSGIVLSSVVIFSYVVKNVLEDFSPASKKFLNLIIGIMLLMFCFVFIKIAGLNEVGRPSKIIGGDFRGAFVFIGTLYILLSFFYKSILANSFNLSLYYFSFVAPSLLLNELNWEYERLGMMMLIPYILSYGILLNRFSYQIYLLIIFILLLFLTIATGMYASFK